MEIHARFALTPVAGAVAAALNPAQQALAQDTDEAALEEIIVTATKRTLSVQDIPASIQAITQDTLATMGARGIEDYSRFIPSVNVISYQNGSNTIVFRGATIEGGGYVAQSTSSVYLDEVSVTTTGSQPSIRAVDVERVEALAGPQGTLYGSDAQAGTMRIITNKPRTDAFEAVVDLDMRGGDQSDPSYSGSLVFNIPLVQDTAALRLVGFSAHDGGFIDNVPGRTPNVNTGSWGHRMPAQWGELDNSAVAKKRWNDSDVYGGRAALRWEFNDSWAATATILHQTTDSGAENDYNPFVGDLQTVRFNPESRKDQYDLYSFVLEGDLGFAQLVSATSYYERTIEQTLDNTVYHHYWATYYGNCADARFYYNGTYYYYDPVYVPYYFVNPDTGGVLWNPVYCHAPTTANDYLSAYDIPQQMDRFAQEIRLSHQGETLDWLLGYYYEDSTDQWQAFFGYPTSNSYQDSISLQYWEWYYTNYNGAPTTFPDAGMHWYSESVTNWDQQAFFGEATWHINDQFDLTVGGRYFDRKNENFYFVEHPETQKTPEYVDGVEAHQGHEKEFIPKVSLAWRFAEDKMAYGLYTRGKRPGGTNRSRGEPFFPNNYDPDIMDNYEIGLRTNFGNGAGRANFTAFHMAWSDFQIELVDPSANPCPGGGGVSIPGECGQPWQVTVANAGDAHITGLNVELDYAFSEAFVFGMNAQWLEAETDSDLDLTGDGDLNVASGNPLPIVPDIKWSAWGEYTRPVDLFGNNNDFFARLQWSYTGETNSILEPIPGDGRSSNPQFVNAAYNIGDLRFGIRGQDWQLDLYINNLTDERAQYQHDTGRYEYNFGNSLDGRDHTVRIFTNRPREAGVRFMKSWGG